MDDPRNAIAREYRDGVFLQLAKEKWLPLVEDEETFMDGDVAIKWKKDGYNIRIVWGVGRRGNAHRSLTRRGILYDNGDSGDTMII